MPIKIGYVGDSKYAAAVTPAKYRDVACSTNAPMRRLPLIDLLVELGYHQQDIGDAFYGADPEWLQRRSSSRLRRTSANAADRAQESADEVGSSPDSERRQIQTAPDIETAPSARYRRLRNAAGKINPNMVIQDAGAGSTLRRRTPEVILHA